MRQGLGQWRTSSGQISDYQWQRPAYLQEAEVTDGMQYGGRKSRGVHGNPNRLIGPGCCLALYGKAIFPLHVLLDARLPFPVVRNSSMEI